MTELKNLVENRENEQVIQRYLKDNLHILAKAYVHSAIDNEYIVFSEFPVNQGSVDFVIFTDRSRMEIIFIEVKGANFSYLNTDGTTSQTINKCHEQILERFDFIELNYEFFRRSAHEIRQRVENGEQIYNSFLGDNNFLHVDPNKEVKYRGIVIGGHTTNDALESKKRHRLEKESNRKIQFESWDSFIRKNEIN